MQGREGRAVGGVADVIDMGVGKLELRVKAGDLKDAGVAVLFHGCVGHGEKVVEVEEVGQRCRVDQQGGVDVLRVALGQPVQLVAEGVEQFRGLAGGAHHVADLAFDLHRLGEWAEVQADHGAVNPGAGFGNDGGGVEGHGIPIW